MELAEKVSARHRMLRKFLTDVLNVDDALADINACRIEHAVDEAVSRRLGYFVEFVSRSAGAEHLGKEFKGFCEQQELTEGDASPGAGGKGPVTLADIKPGQKGKILRLGGAPVTGERLAEAGITRDSVVSVVRVAPLGDPIEIEVNGTRLAIRRTEAIDIEVERLG
jgi:DtxR family Mn-dependent transcriptional regulator